jgi:hypothetical protein
MAGFAGFFGRHLWQNRQTTTRHLVFARFGAVQTKKIAILADRQGEPEPIF